MTPPIDQVQNKEGLGEERLRTIYAYPGKVYDLEIRSLVDAYRELLALRAASAQVEDGDRVAQARMIVDAMLERDDRNGVLNSWWRNRLDLLAAALVSPATVSGPVDLDERMKAAGMIPLSVLLAGETPLRDWMAHTGVRDLDTFEQWLHMRYEESLRMRLAYELGDKDKSDELYEWVLSHAGAFSEVVANFRAMKERSAAPAQGVAVSDDLRERFAAIVAEALNLDADPRPQPVTTDVLVDPFEFAAALTSALKQGGQKP